MFLGLNLIPLQLNYLYLELELNRKSLKDPINVTFTISLLFLKRKRKVMAGILSM